VRRRACVPGTDGYRLFPGVILYLLWSGGSAAGEARGAWHEPATRRQLWDLVWRWDALAGGTRDWPCQPARGRMLPGGAFRAESADATCPERSGRSGGSPGMGQQNNRLGGPRLRVRV
jgi:hypothetical protein